MECISWCHFNHDFCGIRLGTFPFSFKICLLHYNVSATTTPSLLDKIRPIRQKSSDQIELPLTTVPHVSLRSFTQQIKTNLNPLLLRLSLSTVQYTPVRVVFGIAGLAARKDKPSISEKIQQYPTSAVSE